MATKKPTEAAKEKIEKAKAEEKAFIQKNAKQETITINGDEKKVWCFTENKIKYYSPRKNPKMIPASKDKFKTLEQMEAPTPDIIINFDTEEKTKLANRLAEDLASFKQSDFKLIIEKSKQIKKKNKVTPKVRETKKIKEAIEALVKYGGLTETEARAKVLPK